MWCAQSTWSNPIKWSVDEVTDYISKLELDGTHKYNEEAHSFHRENVNGQMLLKLQKDDLNVLGIDHFSKRNALYDHIQMLSVIASDSSHQVFHDEFCSENEHKMTFCVFMWYRIRARSLLEVQTRWTTPKPIGVLFAD